MKTKSNVQKAILRSAAVVVSFVLISFTVSGQDFWKRLIVNSSFNDIALAMVETTNETELPASPAESLKAMYYENEFEPGMELEIWMTDFYTFDVWSQFQVEADNEMGIEKWMIDEDLFQTEGELEEDIELEAWMTSDEVWSI